MASSAILSLVVAWDKASALQAFAWLAAGVSSYFVVSRLGQRRQFRRLVAHALMFWGATVAAYVLLQYRYLGYEVKLEYADSIGRALSAFVPRAGVWNPFSNTVATLLDGILPLTLALVLRRGPRGWKLVEIVSGVVMLIALALVASRGSWLAVGAVCVVWALVWVFRERPVPVGSPLVFGGGTLAAAVVIAAAIGGDSLHGHPLFTVFDRPDRIDVYRNSLVLISDFPFTGIGLGDQFASALARYALLIQVPFLTYSHNLYLDVWIELGLLGIVSFVFLVASICVAAVVGERAQPSTRFRGLWLGLAAMLIHGLVDARQSVDGWTWLPFFVLLGLLAARMRRTKLPPRFVTHRAPTIATAGFLILVLAYLWPLHGRWKANLGTMAQARADFGAYQEEERAHLMTEARARYAEAIQLDRGQPTALRRLGILAIDERRFDDARALLDAAWASDGGNGATQKALGLACAWTGDLKRAQRLLMPGKSIVEELNTWSWWWENQGQAAQAVYAARLSLLMQPEQPDVSRRLMELEGKLAGRSL